MCHCFGSLPRFLELLPKSWIGGRDDVDRFRREEAAGREQRRDRAEPRVSFTGHEPACFPFAVVTFPPEGVGELPRVLRPEGVHHRFRHGGSGWVLRG